LDAFALNRQKYGDEAIALEREKERLKLEVKKMRYTEKKEDEEIAGLALQITATLNKRRSLRLALEEAKDMNKRENDNMLKREKELLQVS